MDSFRYRDKPIEFEDLEALIGREINSAETYTETDLSDDRSRDIEYYHGQMDDVPPSANGSSIVATTIADTMGWMQPSIMKIFTGSDNFARALPKEPTDTAIAEQATDVMNYIFWHQNDGYEVVHSATFDALLHADGIVKVYWDDTPEFRVSTHTGLSQEEVAYLSEQGEIIALEEKSEATIVEVEGEDGSVQQVEQESVLFDLKLKSQVSEGRIKIECIEPENYLRDRQSTHHELSRMEAHRMDEVTRSDLIEMGFDKEVVAGLPIYQRTSFTEEAQARDPDLVDINDVGDFSMDIVELYEVYLKVDVDGDGIAETIRAYYAGAQGAGKLLDWEVYDDGSPFVRIPCEPIPHRWRSRSVADQTRDMQKVETVLMRQLLNNVYDSINPRPMFHEGSVKNPDSLMSPKHGQPIILKRGAQPVEWTDNPFVGTQMMPVFEYVEREIHKRTGTSPGMMAVDPDQLQRVAATTGQNNTDAARMKVEQVARNMAKMGWVNVMKKVYNLFVRHQTKKMTFRLRNEWIEVDPNGWNSEMDVEINVGLGTGSRDRDVMALQAVLGNQMAAMEQMEQFPQKAVELTRMIRDTMAEMAEAAGLRNPEAYFPKFTDEDLATMAEQMGEQPGDPEAEAKAQSIQMEMQIKQQRAEMEMQMAQAKMEDQLKEAEFRREMQRAEAESKHDISMMQVKSDEAVKREKAQAEVDIKRAETEAETQMKKDEAAAQLALKEAQLAEEIALKRELGYAELEVNRELAKAGGDEDVEVSEVETGGEPG